VTEEVQAKRIRLKTREAFPVDDPRVIALLRLMAAANDTRLHHRLFLVTKDPDQPPCGRAERLVQDGEAGYYGRVFLAHLYEAGDALRALDASGKAWVTAAVAGDAHAEAALKRLRETFGGDTDAGFYAFIGKIRNLTTFHYKDAPFREALQAMADETEMVIAQYTGFTRYAIVDVLLDRRVRKVGEETGITVREAIERAVKLADDLEALVLRLLEKHLEARPHTWRAEPTEMLSVPPALQKEAIARRLRGEGGADKSGTHA
jgi:hypothetical protein